MTGDEADSQVERPPDAFVNPALCCVVCNEPFPTPSTVIHHQGEQHTVPEIRRGWANRDAQSVVAI